MKQFSPSLFGLAIVLLSLHAHAAPLTQPPVQSFIVKMRNSADAISLPASGNAHISSFSNLAKTVAPGRSLSFKANMSGGASILSLDAAISPTEALQLAEEISQQPGVEYASPNFRRYPFLVPTDTSYVLQWHLKAAAAEPGSANLEPAWDIATGALAPVVVAVVDSGIIAHPDLAGSTLAGGYDFYSDTTLDNDGSIPAGRDNDPTDPGDGLIADECGNGNGIKGSSWHGTHVSGIIAADTNNASDVAGVNWGAHILPVRVLGKCGGLDSDILDGVRWAAGITVTGVPANTNPAKIINLSLGGTQTCSTAWESAISDVSNLGVTLVYAAGNEAQNVSGVTPAGCARGITVASITRTGARAVYSNFGSGVDIAAPGGAGVQANPENDILSTASSDLTNPVAPATPAYTNEYKAGTSMAAPVVSGVIALMLAQNPALSPAQIEITMRLQARAFPAVTGACDTSNCGAGVVDAFEVMQAVANGDIGGVYTGSGGGTKIESLNGSSTGGSISWLWLFSLSGLLLVRILASRR